MTTETIEELERLLAVIPKFVKEEVDITALRSDLQTADNQYLEWARSITKGKRVIWTI